MSRRYELNATITVAGSTDDVDVLDAVLADEPNRISRSEFSTTRQDDTITIDVNASDATALKTAVSALTSMMRIAEKTGETVGRA